MNNSRSNGKAMALVFVLMAAPLVPSWVRDAVPELFPRDPDTSNGLVALLSVTLFGIAAMIGWWWLQRELDRRSDDDDR